MSRLRSPLKILWLQVLALAAVQGSISIAWLIYNLYLPQLLIQFGFPASLAASLIVIENALSALLEPLMGGLSDKSQRWVGSRFPFISLGVILSSLIFISIPCIVTFTQPSVIMRSLLPITLVAWALAMTIFRSPAMALLGKCATPPELPAAVSVVTLVGGVIGAFRPIANQYILSFGAIFTFATASFVMLAAAWILRWVTPPDIPQDDSTGFKLPYKKLSLILATGFGVAWGTRLLMSTLTKVLKLQFHTDNVDLLLVYVGLAIAFATLPAGFVATKIGNCRAMLVGVAATIISILAIAHTGANLPMIVLLVAGFSTIINGVIPLALGLMSQKWSGLGIGMYFGGFALGMSLFGWLFPQAPGMAIFASALFSALAFLLVAICVMTAMQIQKINSQV
ncbi:MFS transporter [Nostoc sp. FACHB-152]|uniref:MFS transporter n=1 Tax=unclassified Nostoc TaxID=2593658 RepID=UPI001689ED22|nr:MULTISPECIES: MFS transporter [unclassified Nostoc]MBD2446474.1 MFS transporter [Nostoc sp. FACHB-152]MBD2469570.1 MFS transporter [Nostoc sp. FACHB-145]